MDASPATLEFFLLSQLQEKPQSGYELRKNLLRIPTAHFSDSPGSIYPALRRLDRRAWIHPCAAGSQTGRKKTVFELTELGAEEHKKWLQSRIVWDDVVWNRDELMLRFAVIDRVLGKDASLRFLNSLQANIEVYIEELREHLESSSRALTDNARLAFEHGLMQYEATRLWTNKALRRLRDTGENAAGVA